MNKKLKKIMKVLAILVICLISFFGIYVSDKGMQKNIVKEYKKASDLTGYRELIFEVSDATAVLDSEGKKVGNTDNLTDEAISQYNYQKSETKINNDENKNNESYIKTKEIIEKRLKELGILDYNISVNEETGKIFLRLEENSETDHTISNILQVGRFQIRDSEDESKVLIEGKDLKKVSAVYNTTENGTTVYLQIKLNNEATKKFADITENDYKTINNTTESSNTESESNVDNVQNVDNADNTEGKEEKQKKIVLAIDDNTLITTSFDEPIKDGMIHLSMGNSTKDADKVSENLKTASTVAIMLNSGELPLTYKATENYFVKTKVSEKCENKLLYVCIGLIAVLTLFMIIKYKERGFFGAVGFLGYIALLLLLVRYTNVSITVNSIAAIGVMILVSYLNIWNLVKINETDEELKKKQYSKEYKSFISKAIPIVIIAFTFSFIKWQAISTFGMAIFWGLALSIIYNLVVIRKIID